MDDNPFSDSVRSRKLEQEYEELNQTYFQGKLKPYMVFLSKEVANSGYGSLGYCDIEARAIYLLAAERNHTKSLVHEMIHAKLGRYHGPRFQEELRRLGKLGMRLPELDGGWDDRRLSKKRVTVTIEDAIMEGLSDDLVKRYLEREVHTQLSVLQKKYDIEEIIRETRASFSPVRKVE